MTEIDPSKFRSIKDVLVYVNALLLSGKYEEAKTTISVLGLTNAGKTSIIRTLQNGASFLTEYPENKKYIETKVIELVENVELQSTRRQLKISKKPG
jgi:GTP-binding protein EngB required for normal cell division